MTSKQKRRTKRLLCWTTLLGIGLWAGHSHAAWKPEYAQNSPEVREWYNNQLLNEATRQRLQVDWHSCCNHGDLFRTKFKVGGDGGDEWWYLKDNTWKKIPNDIVHWGEHAPDGRPTLFIYQSWQELELRGGVMTVTATTSSQRSSSSGRGRGITTFGGFTTTR
jgi:hypothetical protein